MLRTADERELKLWMGCLDSAVKEVFERMLGAGCSPIDEMTTPGKRIKVAFTLSGRIEGECFVYFSSSAARAAVLALVGDDLANCQPMMDDAVGEIGNMIVGNWKSKLGPARAMSTMSVPKVLREGDGTDFELSYSSSRRAYLFLGNPLEIELTIPPQA